MSTQTDALANVYARSLFELATDAGGTDKVLEIRLRKGYKICKIKRKNVRQSESK